MSNELEAILSFDSESLRQSLTAGGDPNKHLEGQSLLEWACAVGNEEAAILLLGSGADPNTRTDKGETPLMLASYSGLLGAVRAMLTCQVKLDALDELGRDALMLAAKGGRADGVALLCEAGASATRRDFEGRTALQWALVEGDNRDAVTALIAHGALAGDQAAGDTAMQYAGQLGRHLSAEVILGAKNSGASLKS